MTTITGSVSLRKPDGSSSEPISGANVFFQPLDTGGQRVATTTNTTGRYMAELAPGNWLGMVSERDAGASPAWVRTRVRNVRRKTLNFFLDDPLTRLQGLANAFPGEIGVFARNLASNQRVAINADTPRYLASVAKVPIAVGCVDQMRDQTEINDAVDLTVYDHRDEGKRIAYEDLGTGWTVRNLMQRMIASSDTTATDVLSAKYGIAEINKRLNALTDGFSQLSSMIELDRRRYWLGNARLADLPPFALSLFRRHGITSWVNELGLTIPSRDMPEWDEYRADGREQASPRTMSALLEAIGKKELFNESWKNDLMLDTILAFGSAGRFSPSIDSKYIIDGKGGSHTDVTNEAGLVRASGISGDPLATLVVFTERRDAGISGRAVGSITAEAGELALRALGFDLQLSNPNATSTNPIVFLAPRPGLAFEQGDRPVIRWDTAGITGRLTLMIEDGQGNQTTITTRASDDGEWHSYLFPDDLPSKDEYRFRLTGIDGSGNSQTAVSSWFSVGGSIHVTRPVAGEACAPGSTPPIRWASNGVTGDLTIRLLRRSRVIDTFSTRARDDGAWNSWTIPDDMPRGGGYQIEVRSNDESRIRDRSPTFVIGGRIDVLAPAYEDVLDIGSRPRIRWQTENVQGPLRIELFGLGHDPLLSIATNATDDGEWHSWEVPDIADGIYYRIRVSERNNGAIEGYSSIFQLGTRYQWIMPSLDGAARGNSTLQSRPHFVPYEDQPSLRWRRIGADKGQLVIDLLRNGNRVERISGNANDDGEWHSWTASEDLRASSRYTLNVFARDKPTAMGRSVFFSIGAQVAVSVGRKSITNGGNVTIMWQTDGLDNTALGLALLDEDGSTLQNLGRSADGDTQMVWTVNTQATPRRARIRARSRTEREVEGYSEWFDLN